ncbi:MAG: hypothetical protein ACE37D_15215, partial [Pseudomonadales bacterium]
RKVEKSCGSPGYSFESAHARHKARFAKLNDRGLYRFAICCITILPPSQGGVIVAILGLSAYAVAWTEIPPTAYARFIKAVPA